MPVIRGGGKIRPTRSEFLRSRRRLKSLQEGLDVLTMKRDQLTQDLQVAIGNLSDYKEALEEKLREAYRALIAAYMTLGPSEIEMQAEAIQGTLNVKVIEKNIMGTLVPQVNIVNRPTVKGKVGTVAYGVAKRFHELLDELVKVAEMENEIIRVSEELHETNSKVNALEKVVIPELKGKIKYIDDRLEEEALEALVQLKIIRETVLRRRS